MIQGFRLGAICTMVALSLGLSACGVWSSSTPTPPPVTYTVGGTVSGLAAGQSVILLNSGGEGYTATASGAFSFATGLATGASYTVTVGTQPSGQICTVTHGSGAVASSNITNVAVNCLNQGESVLYSFAGTDGRNPGAELILDSSGALYGTTFYDGTNNAGTVFKLTPDGKGGYTESVLHSFGTGTDGSNPSSGLILDSSGALYGTTHGGGTNGAGTVFRVVP